MDKMDDELIITSQHYEDSPTFPITVPTPESKIEFTEDIEEDDMYSLDSVMEWIQNGDNKIWAIHTIVDAVLFYMFLRFIQQQFDQTEHMIHNTQRELNELKKQYGLE